MDYAHISDYLNMFISWYNYACISNYRCALNYTQISNHIQECKMQINLFK